MSRYSDYDAFASIYDEHWGSQALRALPVLDRLLLGALRPRGLMLRLGGNRQTRHLVKIVDAAAGLRQPPARLEHRSLKSAT